ncbi:uncharacterized protein LTR77_005920 [Saxophila tyrrhenica]|uniref:DSBA-like thioredoxin domain-containing protein n=1 Tax=Saxophila tyrrhenica TaxID=1690608 RepID=A0AAV9P6P6_9PEZI|nr:hypothetical protein LTR77_005920 [Saxophila tyrrhenica]
MGWQLTKDHMYIKKIHHFIPVLPCFPSAEAEHDLATLVNMSNIGLLLMYFKILIPSASSHKMTHFEISIVSDTVCPWCYIGLRNLQAAIAQRTAKSPTDTFSLTWDPFQLNPQAPRGQTVDKRASYEKKLGVDGARTVFERLTSAGETAGIQFSFDGRTGNTLDSHRLLELARKISDVSEATSGQATHSQADLQTRLAEELFADYFERERDITDHEVLKKAALRAGLDERGIDILAFLASDDLVDLVQREASAQREEGINGVPHFTINDDILASVREVGEKTTSSALSSLT